MPRSKKAAASNIEESVAVDKVDAVNEESVAADKVNAVNEESVVTDKVDTVNEESIVVEDSSYIYLGPTKSKYGLISNMIYRGSRADVEKYLENSINAQPLIKKLLVPVSQIKEKQKQLNDKNNSFYNLYKEVLKM